MSSDYKKRKEIAAKFKPCPIEELVKVARESTVPVTTCPPYKKSPVKTTK